MATENRGYRESWLWGELHTLEWLPSFTPQNKNCFEIALLCTNPPHHEIETSTLQNLLISLCFDAQIIVFIPWTRANTLVCWKGISHDQI